MLIIQPYIRKKVTKKTGGRQFPQWVQGELLRFSLPLGNKMLVGGKRCCHCGILQTAPAALIGSVHDVQVLQDSFQILNFTGRVGLPSADQPPRLFVKGFAVFCLSPLFACAHLSLRPLQKLSCGSMFPCCTLVEALINQIESCKRLHCVLSSFP